MVGKGGLQRAIRLRRFAVGAAIALACLLVGAGSAIAQPADSNDEVAPVTSVPSVVPEESEATSSSPELLPGPVSNHVDERDRDVPGSVQAPERVVRGSIVTLSGSGWSDCEPDITFTADWPNGYAGYYYSVDGSFSKEVPVPTDVALGIHTIVVAACSSTSVNFEVVEAGSAQSFDAQPVQEAQQPPAQAQPRVRPRVDESRLPLPAIVLGTLILVAVAGGLVVRFRAKRAHQTPSFDVHPVAQFDPHPILSVARTDHSRPSFAVGVVAHRARETVAVERSDR